MSGKMRLSCAAVVALALVVALAGGRRALAADDSKGVSEKDKKFITEAAAGGMTEVTLGKHAADNATSAEVKQFGQMMVDDHSKANDELKALAQSKGITVPTELDAKHQKMVDKLTKMSGADFDKAYMKAMVKDHTEDVKEFTTESEKGDDADVKAWAAKTLPTLQSHLDKAKEINKSLGSAKKEGGEAK